MIRIANPPEASRLPSHPGTYALLLHLAQTTSILIGRLGVFTFPQGAYVYVGSALGAGGLAGRLRRQLKPASSRATHWHVDYLRLHTELQSIWYRCQDRRAEHVWAQALHHLPLATIVAPRFGASDCRCPSHLYHFPQPPNPSALQARLSG
ncbi:MAG: GIY-YIG nuclease family protein [Candidatus Promineifilaceae bacterium]|nr:GIY-YIG nuclease family protein [Candidatus Promineifilaceae bacterium]